MHTYSIENDELRTKLIIVIFIISLVLSYLLNAYVLTLIPTEIISKIPFIMELSALSVFGFIKVLFDKFIWCLLSWFKFIDIPNLNGKWRGHYKSSKDGDTDIEIPMECTIKQTWTKIGVFFSNNARADSKSIMACMVLEASPILRYEYINSPPERGVAMHTGTCKLKYDREEKTLIGEYYNDRHNGHSGTINLIKL